MQSTLKSAQTQAVRRTFGGISPSILAMAVANAVAKGKAPVGIFGAFAAWYDGMLDSNPVALKTGTAFVLSGLGNSIGTVEAGAKMDIP